MMPVSLTTFPAKSRISRVILVGVFTLTTGLILGGCRQSLSNPESTFGDEAALSLSGETATNSNARQNTKTNDTDVSQKAPMADQGPRTLEDFEPIEDETVTITTEKGKIVLDLYTDRAPLTTTNFMSLVKDGYYDGQRFHRIIDNFVVQFGDPQSKDTSKQARWGTGGPGYVIQDEFHPELRHDSAGILSMANRGPNTGASQIFITLDPQPHLDDKHAVFGEVSEGMDVVQSLEVGDVIQSATLGTK